MNNMSTFWGAVFIVAGTTIGAGMLALPLSSLDIGFGTTILLLVGLWAFMLENALVYVDCCKHEGHGLSTAQMAGAHLGVYSKLISNVAILGLFLALLSAYVSGGSGILHAGIGKSLGTSRELVTVLFSGVMGFILYFNLRVTDFYNRIFFALKICFFAVLCFYILRSVPHISLPNLPRSPSTLTLVTATGIFFTSFGFHGSIPALINYMKTNNNKLRHAFIIGSLVPLMLYILWVFVAQLGVSFSGNDAISALSTGAQPNDLLQALNKVVNTTKFYAVAQIFSLLAIITSLLGVAVGLIQFLKEQFTPHSTRHVAEVATKVTQNKFDEMPSVTAGIAAFSITKIVPLAISLLYPSIFVFALQFAGIALAIIAVIIPNMVALKLSRNKSANIRGGKPLAVFNLAVGGTFIIGQVLSLLS